MSSFLFSCVETSERKFEIFAMHEITGSEPVYQQVIKSGMDGSEMGFWGSFSWKKNFESIVFSFIKRLKIETWKKFALETILKLRNVST